LGTTLYEMLTGSPAFPETNIHKLVVAKCNNRYLPLERYHTRIPAGLRRLIRRCMQHDRSRRPLSAARMVDELTRIHRAITPRTPEEVMKEFAHAERGKVVLRVKGRLPFAKIVVIAALAVCAGLVAVSYINKPRPSGMKPPTEDVRTSPR
jgi:serine/threonine protein kinase